MNYKNLLENHVNLDKKYCWLVTGSAGFIGSNLTEALLSLNQNVIGLDDFTTGKTKNLELATKNNPQNFTFIKGSINDFQKCDEATKNVDFILHHAALISVPESLDKPVKYHSTNTTGFTNILEAARNNGVKRVVYASSSAVYGDAPENPKSENNLNPENFLSPYALTKYINEKSAKFYSKIYNLETVGLRYFNIFGPRQDPSGAYAAVISKWVDALQSDKIPIIYGDGKATRDFCAVHNVVLANILAAIMPELSGKVFNIGCGIETNLNELLRIIYKVFAPDKDLNVKYESPRKGDILKSSANIELAKKYLNYKPIVMLEDGLKFLKESL